MAAAAVRDFVEALRDGDAGAAAALAPAGDTAAQAALSAAARNVDLLGAEVQARYLDETTALHENQWTAEVALTWRFPGYDKEAAQAEIGFEFERDDDRVSIMAAGVGDGVSPVWLRGPVEVLRTRQLMVIASGESARRRARVYWRRSLAAIAVVQRVLTTWRPRMVVEVPASAADLDRTLGVESGTYRDIAAVTATADASGRSGAPVRIYVNPDVTGRLRDAGAQVVLNHEAVHLATDAPGSRMETWLLEGFADYVALRDVDLPLSVTAARAAAVVRRDGIPERLPTEAEFATDSEELEASYELAWLACLAVVDEVGESGLLSLYDAALAGQDIDGAMRDNAVSRQRVTAVWQARLAELVA